jgi:hypothetical protein
MDRRKKKKKKELTQKQKNLRQYKWIVAELKAHKHMEAQSNKYYKEYNKIQNKL